MTTLELATILGEIRRAVHELRLSVSDLAQRIEALEEKR